MNREQANELIGQVGAPTILATSGGRVRFVVAGDRPDTSAGTVSFPVSNGYRVEVDLDASDTYTVRRVFVRSGRRFVKGTETYVHCDEISETVYRAGCFRNVPFGS